MQELQEAIDDDSVEIFNAAVTSGDPVAIDFLTDRLLEAGVRPSVAVVEISPESVARRNSQLKIHLTRQFRWPDVLRSLPDVFRADAVPRLFSSRAIPVYFFRSEFQQWTVQTLKARFPAPTTDPPENPTTTTHAQEPTTTEPLELGVPIAQRRLRSFEVGGISVRALERLIERYRRLGTAVVLVGVPLSSPYRGVHTPEISAVFYDYMRRLRETYGIQFVDYHDRIPDELFRSTYYTTAEGRLYFSRLLAREVLVPLWRDRSLQASEPTVRR
jgi:hypothetical protein